MRARVRVVSTTDYEAWLGDQEAAIQEAQEAVQQEIEAGTQQSAEPEAQQPGEAFEEGAEPPAGGGGGNGPRTEDVGPETAEPAPGGGS
jgi:hypothetical protein